MNKKFLSAILFGALMVTSTGTFVSCKDYDDDINDLQGQIDKKASIEELNAKVSSIESSLNAALADAAAAKKAAQEAKDEAKATAAAAKEAAIKAAQDKVAELKEEIMNSVNASLDEMNDLKADVEALVEEVGALVGHRLTSVALIPTQHINGIAAITVNTLMYTPQTYAEIEEHDLDRKGNHKNRPMLDHVDAAEAAARFISSNSNVAKFHLNPSLGVRPQDILLPSFDCITSTNITRGAGEELAGLNSPIMATPLAEGEELDIKDGILTLKIQKSPEALETFIGTDGQAHDGQTNKESFYMASLKVPVAEANWTAEEKEAYAKGDITGVYVNSEYSRIEEIVRIPYLVNSRTDFDKVLTNEFADEMQKDDKGDFYVHYHDSVCLYTSKNNELVDVKVAYNETLDLKELVTVCAVDAEVVNGDPAGNANDHTSHEWLEDYADYGLAFRFELADDPYLQGDRKTDEQEFASIDSPENGIMSSRVYTVGGDSRAAIGREPIVRVRLIDTNNDDALVAQRYIKVRWTEAGAPEQTIPSHPFKKQYVTCMDMFQQLGTQEMNEEIYHQVKMMTEGGSATNSISKENFHKIYTDIEIVSLKKDGEDLLLDKDLALVTSTDASNIEEGTSKTEIDGLENIDDKSGVDVVFAFLEDNTDSNTSWNLVWAMTPKAVGTLKDLKASEFEITVKYKDPEGVHGTVEQTFTQTIEIPTQEFAYQGTYWKDGVGEGVFNVNPIVYRTSTDGSVKDPHSATCKLKDYSHIEADLLNGYIYKATNKKPANLDEYIQYIRGCADVKFIFDADRFANYEHLDGYVVDETSTQLFNVEPFTLKTAVDNGKDNITIGGNKICIYKQKEGIAATINNFIGATNVTNKDKNNYAWEYDEPLGSGKDECISIIRLHELDDKNATEAAKALVGKKVPVNLVVEYNEYNIVTEQEFEVFFINPLEIDGAVGDNFTDAVVNGDFLSVAENFTFTDWNKYTVAKAAITGDDATEKDAYAHDLYDYYAVKNVVFATDQVKTSLALEGNTYIHKEGVTDGNLPTNASLKQMIWDETQAKSTAYETDKDPSHLAYFNYQGTPVNVDYQLFVDVKVDYKWGTLTKAGLPIWVKPAEGTNDANQGTTGDNTGSDNENNG